MTPSSSLRDKVLADSATKPARTRQEGRRRALVVYAVAALAGLPLFFAWGGFAHGRGRPPEQTFGIALGALLLGATCASVAWWRGKSMVGRSRAALVGIALFAPAATYVWLVSWHGRYVEPFARIGYRCLTLTIVAGLPLLVGALWLRKRTVASHPTASGAALGAAAGALGAVGVDVWCPLTNSPHVLVGHVLPIAALLLTGAGAGRVFLGIRPRR